jgi:ribosome-associated protein
MLEITPTIHLNEEELHFDFIRSAGPGGQNVNKVATAVQMRFSVRESPSLAPDVKERLIKLAGNRMTDDGILIIEAKRTRSQEKNRLDAIQRLVKLIQQAAEPPKLRKKTRPSAGASAVRMADKRKRGDAKRLRQYNPEEWE